MKEVTKISLGRQAFLIAVDAYKALQDYLHAVKRHMNDADEVVDEIELRMAELLTERGVCGDNVVLLKDIEYLKQQLGEPGDFGDEEDRQDTDDSGTKRLFRDSKHAMIAGVSAGIAKYINIDPTWIRLAFVALVFAGGSGILIYTILWLIIPEAKTSSDRLQMQGKSVTIDSLKEIVERVDVKGVAGRVTGTATNILGGGLRAALMILGVGLATGAMAIILALISGSVFFWLNYEAILPFNIFPVEAADHVLVGLIIACVATIALFVLSAGVAFIKHRWILPGWASASLFVIFFSSAAVGAALGAGIVPKVVDRYEAAHNTEVLLIQPFTSLNVVRDHNQSRPLEVVRHGSGEYKVEFRYLGKADTKDVTIKEQSPGVIELNATGFKSDPACSGSPCLFNDSDLQIIIYAPGDKQIEISDNYGAWYSVFEDYQSVDYNYYR